MISGIKTPVPYAVHSPLPHLIGVIQGTTVLRNIDTLGSSVRMVPHVAFLNPADVVSDRVDIAQDPTTLRYDTTPEKRFSNIISDAGEQFPLLQEFMLPRVHVI